MRRQSASSTLPSASMRSALSASAFQDLIVALKWLAASAAVVAARNTETTTSSFRKAISSDWTEAHCLRARGQN